MFTPRPRTRTSRAAALLALALALALPLAACGREPGETPRQPVIGKKGKDEDAARALGFPVFATKNTTRVGGADPVADAAGTARAVFPGGDTEGARPTVVALADKDDWRAGIAAAALMSRPVRAPLLLSDGNDLPGATKEALKALSPRGERRVGNAQVIRIGEVARPRGYESTDVTGANPFALARAIDSLASAASGRTSDRVVIASAQRPEYAMPAAAWAAKSGDPVLFVERDRLPPETRAAIATHQQPRIYLLGPRAVVGRRVERELRRLGTVRRIQGRDPVRNAIAFARFIDGPFGWGVVDPGHGLVFAAADRPADAGAVAPLSASGTYGPLLLLDDAATLPSALEDYLLSIQPGYRSDPVRGVYNHGWLIGDEGAISTEVQSRIDALLEIQPANESRPTP